jgi:hypothetical protein
VETREKGGILEKYYRAVARHFMVPMSLTRQGDPTALFAAVNDYVGDVVRRFLSAFGRATREHIGERTFTLTRDHIWATPDELRELIKAQDEELARFREPRGIEGETEVTFVHLMHPTALDESDLEAGHPGPSVRRTTGAGVLGYNRRDLEEVVARGQRLDMTVYGLLTLARDVSPDLARGAFERLRLHGKLDASDEVRAALQEAMAADRRDGAS